MERMDAVVREIERRTEIFIKEQRPDGSWRYCFEGPIMTDAFIIITLRSLESNEEALIERMAHRIHSKQGTDGTWKAFPDEEGGNLTATIHGYLALLYSGYWQTDDEKMKKAAAFIRSNGGLKKAGLLTRAFLAMNGLCPWPRLPFNPAYIVLFPLSFPINFFEFSAYARAHFAPVLAAAEHRFSLRCPWTPDIRPLNNRDSEYWPEIEAFFTDPRSTFSALKEEFYKWKQIPRNWLDKADRWIERYMLTRLESNGTLLSYASTTILMVYGLLALGYDKQSIVILRAIEGLKSLIWEDKQTFHLQNSPSAVWDTALMSYALLESGKANDDPSLRTAASYLLKKQQDKSGDWAFHNPGVTPGGWGFSDSDTFNPDNDDTQTALRTIKAFTWLDRRYNASFQRGTQWLLSMQNRDGGWAAFEKNTDNYLLTLFPMKEIESAALDPSTPDLTGRTLEFLGTDLAMNLSHPRVDAAVRWLKNRQQKNGSWYGRWGVCYIYGTWAALTGLTAAGLPSNDPCIGKVTNWLKAIQNEDGGWGESCISDAKKHYVPLGASTIVQTAWAVDALIAVSEPSNNAIDRGIDFLLAHNDVNVSYPVGAGLPGFFYVNYHGYPRYWPLLALAHYHTKYA